MTYRKTSGVKPYAHKKPHLITKIAGKGKYTATEQNVIRVEYGFCFGCKSPHCVHARTHARCLYDIDVTVVNGLPYEISEAGVKPVHYVDTIKRTCTCDTMYRIRKAHDKFSVCSHVEQANTFEHTQKINSGISRKSRNTSKNKT